MSRTLPAALVTATLLVTGCTVGPDYVRPETPTTEAWSATLDAGLKAAPLDPTVQAQWWTQLDDPLLSELVAQASAGNLDLKTAQARVDRKSVV